MQYCFFCLIPTPTVGTAGATEDAAGTTSAVLNVSTQVGGALGLAVSASVVQHKLNSLATLTTALHAGIATLFVFVGLSLLTGLIAFRGRPGKSAEAAGATRREPATV